MKQYYEAREILPGDRVESPEFIRIDVTGMTDAERVPILQGIKDVMSGVKCKFSLHNCGHDEGKACTMDTI
uniref:Uncharacterized protein n=1 Tax=viral metagenome TaxID=1070528 RepID=A0A6M3KK27_9ZZZZ